LTTEQEKDFCSDLDQAKVTYDPVKGLEFEEFIKINEVVEKFTQIAV